MLNTANRYKIKLGKDCINLGLNELIELKKIPNRVEQYCEQHSNYISYPIAKIDAFGEVIYSECPHCAKEREIKKLEVEAKIESERKIARENEKIETLLQRGCGKKYLKYRNNLRSDTELLSNGLAEYLLHNSVDFLKTENIILVGGCGIGKTFFANRMVEIAYELGKNYLCITAFELVGIYKSKNINGFSRTNSFENIEDLLEEVECVILDEVDYFLRGSKDAREEEALHHLAQICERDDKRVILLGNCNRKELKDALPPKVYSRFRGGAVIQGWGMKDLRIKE